MTPDENETLYNAGKSLRLDSFTLFSKATFYGIFLLLNGLTIFQLTNRRSISRPAKFLLLMILLLTISTTIEVSRSLAILVINVETIVMGFRTDNGTLAERQLVASATLRPIFAIASWTTGFNFLCGDIIMVWRAAQLYSTRSFAAYSLLTVIILDACATFTSGTLSTRAYVRHNITGVELIPDPVEKRYVVGFYNFAYWWSLVTNVYATTCFAIKAWIHIRRTRRVGVKSSVGPAIITFVETGFAFCCMQLAFNILWQCNIPPFNIPLDIFYVAVLFTSAIYPSAIILILRYRLSVVDNTNTLYDSRPTLNNKYTDRTPIQIGRIQRTDGTIGLQSLNTSRVNVNDHGFSKSDDVESASTPVAESSVRGFKAI